jgi:hypothetical protein
MLTMRLDFKGHNFNSGRCVCGLTREQYDDLGQPPCPGPQQQAPRRLPGYPMPDDAVEQ